MHLFNEQCGRALYSPVDQNLDLTLNDRSNQFGPASEAVVHGQ